MSNLSYLPCVVLPCLTHLILNILDLRLVNLILQLLFGDSYQNCGMCHFFLAFGTNCINSEYKLGLNQI